MAMRCGECGAEIVDGGVFCQKCGHRLDADQDPQATAPEPVGDDTPDVRVDETGDRQSADDSQFVAEKIRNATGGQHDADEERELWDGGYCGKSMVGNWVVAGLLVIVISIVGFYFFSTTVAVYIMLISAVVILGGVGCQMLYRKMEVHYSVTNQRLIHRKGVLRRVTDRIEMIDIDDVTFEQGPIQRMVGVGTIKVLSSDRTHPTLLLHGIDDVQRVAELIDDTRRDERRRRGLHIEQI